MNKWVSNYLSSDLSGLEDKPRLGRQPLLTQTQQAQLVSYINLLSQSDEGGHLTGKHIKYYIAEQFGVNYHLNHIYKLLAKLKFNWITSRSRHPKQSQEAQDEFKKTAD